LMLAWCRVVDEATEELAGGKAYRMAQSIGDDFIRGMTLEDSLRLGESGQPRLVDGQDPSDISSKVRELLKSQNIRIPAALHRFEGQ